MWFDEGGVPRYVPFHPNRCALLGAEEALLAEVRCQGCGQPFLVALTWRDAGHYPQFQGLTLPPADRLTKIGGNSLHYGDPPDIGCCDAGPTMGSDFHRIVQAWIRTAGPMAPWIQLDQEAIDAIDAKSEVGVWE
jgi:hypothetical protein